jgi:predicted Zn-dependent peptidase
VRAAAELLADSTTFETYTLANGLRVAARHVPASDKVAIAVAYAFGSADDAPESEGLRALLAELAFTAPAGGAPGRTRSELPSQRPAGWDIVVGQRTTTFIEVATLAQFPGVLRQVAQRMRGVQPVAATLDSARARVRADLDQRWNRGLGAPLYLWARAAAERRPDESVAREASGGSIARLPLRQLEPALARDFVPANAVLSLVGNLSALPVRELLEREMGAIPPGTRRAQPPPAALTGGSRVLPREGIPYAATVIGVIAPALEDTLHPAFYAASLLFATHAGAQWGRPGSAIGTRFRYVLTEDPGLVRVFPPIAPDATDGHAAIEEFVLTVRQGAGSSYPPGTVQGLWRGVDFLLGGPIPPERIGPMRTDGAALATIANGQAFRELTGGEAFWSEYRRRFKQASMSDPARWMPALAQPERLVQVTFRQAP